MNQDLCIYRDEALGANPLPLRISGENLNVRKSSNYFTGAGIKINLVFDAFQKIKQIQLGPDILIDLATLRKGVEVGPLGLLAVHTLQCDGNFDAERGGLIRFGFLKNIFIGKVLLLVIKNIFSSFFSKNKFSSSNEVVDITKKYEGFFGLKQWGTCEIAVKKNSAGRWIVASHPDFSGDDTLAEIVAKFDVSRTGVVLGIKEMYFL